MGAAVIIIIAALMYFKHLTMHRGRQEAPQATAAQGFVKCPVCGIPLLPKDNLVSKVFRPMDVSDQLCVIYGCPRCYPHRAAGITRVCPVCKNCVPDEEYLVARLFNKTKSGGKHVIINGCKRCCRTKI